MHLWLVVELRDCVGPTKSKVHPQLEMLMVKMEQQ